MDQISDRDPLSAAVIGAAIEVHRELGPGLLEHVCQKCLEWELSDRGIVYVPQVHCPLVYKGRNVELDFVIDILIPDQLIIELKAVEKVLPVHRAQLLTYLKLMKIKTGLLLNFNVPVLKNGVTRMVN